ncbi:hypothetical protein [Paraoerskovia sediminicola]|nr:hypothetical protein [Paraoerskovia sediminicola]
MPPRTNVTAVVGVTLLTVALSACGVRLDSPPPSEPSPDAHEVIRASAVADALEVEQIARTLAEDLPADDPGEKLLPLLEEIADFADQHAVQLGGTYDSGLPEAPQSVPVVPSSSATSGPLGPEDLVDALAGASVRGRAGADSTGDGALARLLASISTSQILSAEDLVDVTGDDLPDTIVPATPAVPESAPRASRRTTSTR